MMPGATRYANFHGDRFGGFSNGQTTPWENEGPAGYRGSFNMEDRFQEGNFRNGGFQNPPPMRKKPTRVQSGYDSYEEDVIDRVLSRMVGKQSRAPKPSFQPRRPMPNQARNVPQFRNNQYSEGVADYQNKMQYPQSRPSFQPRRQMASQKVNRPQFARDELAQAISEYQNEMQSAPRPKRNPQGWQGHPGFAQQQDNRSVRPQRGQHPQFAKQSVGNRLQYNPRPVSAPGYQNKKQNFNNTARFAQVQDNRRPAPRANNKGKFEPAAAGYIKSVNQFKKTPKVVAQKSVPAKRPKLATSSKAFKPPQKKNAAQKKPQPQKAKAQSKPKAQPKPKAKPVQPAEPKKKPNAQIEESEKIIVPLEALQCHVCNIDSFVTKKAFYVHMSGETHKEILDAYSSKRNAQLEYMANCSKLSMLRNGAKLTSELGEKPKKVPKSVEKSVYDSFKKMNSLSCCGERFDTYIDLEGHKLRPIHLAKEYIKKTTKVDEEGKGESTLPSLPRTELTQEKILELIWAAKGDCEVPQNSNLFPVYDPSVMCGLNYVQERQEWRLLCTVCNTGMVTTAMPGHMQSEKHYNGVIKYYEEINRKAYEEKKARKEKERQERIELKENESKVLEEVTTNGEGEEIPKEQRQKKSDEEDTFENAEADLD